MSDMTDEEYAALDEQWTLTTPQVNFARPGVFAGQRYLLSCLDPVTANYILSRSAAAHKPPAQIIADMVREKITASA